MTDLYEQLKAEAAKKRSAAVQRARREYKDTLIQIDRLRSRLGYEAPAGKPKRQRSMKDLVLDVMPKDRAFTFVDIYRLLCDAEPARTFNQVSLRTLLRQMATEGIVDRITKNQSGRVLWAVKGANVAPCPFGPKSLIQIGEGMLRDRGPMTLTELVVAIKETGYRPDALPKRMLDTLRTSMRRHPDRFAKGADGRWSVG